MAESQRPRKIVKSRSGCRACKQKRMKCDEAEPECKNCVKRRITCPGYTRPLKWSTKHELLKQPYRSPTIQDFSLHDRIEKSADCVSAAAPSSVLCQKNVIRSSTASKARRRHSDSSVQDASKWPAASDVPHLPAASKGSLDSHSAMEDICSHVGLLEGEQGTEGVAEWVTNYDNYSGWTLERPLPLSNFSQDDAHTDRLLSHYFSVACRVMSCFDSESNPYRTDIPQALNFSPHMFHCMMTMAAAHLTNYEGAMAITTLDYQTKAFNMLQDEMTRLALVTHGDTTSPGTRYQVLLGTIMLGMTSAWHDPSAYALSHLKGARLLFHTWAAEQGLLGESGKPRILTREECFIVGSMAYWEGLASFLVDQSLNTLDYLLPYCAIADGQKIYPHSWTGISFPIFVYLAQVGTLLRQKRIIAKLAQIGRDCPRTADADSGLLADAEKLHSKVLTYTLPQMATVEGTGDPNTPVSHLCDLAKIYRYVLLLELYQAFPGLRAQDEVGNHTSATRTQENSQQLVFDLATCALTLMSNLPRSSGIITVLAIAYISAGSALQNTEVEHQGDPLSLNAELYSMRRSRSAVQTWRENVRQHVMHAFRELGIASIQRCAKLVQEAWSRSDIQIEMGTHFDTVLPVHWMDVMIEQKLETLYG